MSGNEVEYPTPNTIIIDDWIQFQYPMQNFNIFRRHIDNLIKNVMAMPHLRFNEFQMKIVTTLRDILDAQETVISLPYPTHIGQKPKFLTPRKENGYSKTFIESKRNNENWRAAYDRPSYSRGQNAQNRENWRNPGTSEQNSNTSKNRNPNYKNKSENFYEKISNNFSRNKKGNYSYFPNNNDMVNTAPPQLIKQSQNSNGKSTSPDNQNWRPIRKRSTSDPESDSSSPPPDIQVAQGDSASRLLSALNNPCRICYNPDSNKLRAGCFTDKNIYVLIKPKTITNVTIAFDRLKWVFAPQTEKKIKHFSKVSEHYIFQNITFLWKESK